MDEDLNSNKTVALIAAFIKAGDAYFERSGRMIATSETAKKWVKNQYGEVVLENPRTGYCIVSRESLLAVIDNKELNELRMMSVQKRQPAPHLN